MYRRHKNSWKQLSDARLEFKAKEFIRITSVGVVSARKCPSIRISLPSGQGDHRIHAGGAQLYRCGVIASFQRGEI
jgi:hypothetical protein